jgi:GT2 family glycosyltransferase
VLNWNGYDNTSVCLWSLQQLHYANHEVIVVDNGSTDDSVSRIRSEFPSVHLMETGRNLGFSGGCNVAIRYALAHSTDFVWLLNNDTTVDPYALQAMIDVASGDHKIGAVGSALSYLDNPEKMQAWGGGFVNFWLGRSRHFLSPVPDESIEFITGASLLISREALESIGLLDEGFFMYWEDADYCFRLRAAGFRLAVARLSKVRHEECGSVGKGSAKLDTYFNESAARFFKRHAPIPVFSLWVGVGARVAKRLLVGDWTRTRAVLKGVLGRAHHRILSGPVTNLNPDKWQPWERETIPKQDGKSH